MTQLPMLKRLPRPESTRGMGKFIVCASFLDGCASDSSLFSDVLFEFPKDNSLTVCIDAPDGAIMNSYREVAKSDKNNLIGTWLYCMINRSALTFEVLGVALSAERLKFFELAVATGGETPVIVWSKSSWAAVINQMPEVWVMDRLEGKRAVKKIVKGKEVKRMSAKKVGNGAVSITGGVIQVGNINSDHGVAHVGTIHGRAILDLEERYGGSTSPEILSEVRTIQNQFRSASPDQGILEGAWARLVALAPDVTSVASAVGAVGAILGHP